MTALPRGFRAHVGSIGIKDALPDFVVIAADRACPAAAVFTKSRFEGPSVTISRRHVADGRLCAFTVVSRNANVATGEQGRRDAPRWWPASRPRWTVIRHDVLVASTGVIGRPYPMDRIRPHLAGARRWLHRARGRAGGARP